ncbi:protein JINGUBANG-like [Chenopodium quinoa]|uniref:protein JINGUBANG-like n=1 Tax=Chenopodium quinoa TaxID=63459 RepID=UPI000B778631|nr:protein JINGUBANG-like [Chenopodium quinoa]
MCSILLNPKRSLSTPLLYLSSSATNSSSSTSSNSSEAAEDNPNNIMGYPRPFQIVKNVEKIMAGSTSKSYKLLDVLSGHVGAISCLALCGEFVLSASQGKDIIVWQQPDLRLFTKFGAGEGSVKALVTVGNKVFTAHQDSRIRVWKVSKRSENVFRLVDTLPTTKDYLGKCMKQSNYVQIRRHHKKLWIEHADSISCLAVENGLIYSGSWDKTLKVWRLSDLRCLESIKAHDDAINGLIAKNGVVYSASADGKIKVWGKESGKKNSSSGSSLHKLEGVLAGHKDVSMNAVIGPDHGNGDGDENERVYGGASDGYLMGWERGREGEWKLVVEVKAHQLSILCLSFMGDILCSGSADKSICLWKRDDHYNFKDGLRGGISKIGVIRGHDGPIKCLQVSPNCVGGGFLLYSGSLDKSLRVWWVSKDISDEDKH